MNNQPIPESVLSNAERTSVNLLYGNSVGSIATHVIVSLIIAFILNDSLPRYEIYVWLALMNTLQFLRIVDFIYWKVSLLGTAYCSQAPKIRTCTLNYLSSVSWMAYSVYFLSDMTVEEYAALAIVIFTLAGAVGTTMAGNIKLAVSYALTMTVPFALLSLTSSITFINTLGQISLIFIVVMTISVFRAIRFTRNAILSKTQNEALLAKQSELMAAMQQKNDEISAINANLEHKVEERTQHIWYLSNQDPLTGLFNRKAFKSVSQLVLDKSKQDNTVSDIALLFIDLDGFKAVNDQYGHAVGDKVLKVASRKLHSIVEEKAHLCRWGGDEFILLLEGCDQKEAYNIATLIVEALSMPMPIDGFEPVIGATIGVALYVKGVKDLDELIEQADEAMYEQKQTEKNKVRIYQSE